MQERPDLVDDARIPAGEELNRDERVASRRRTLVLQPAAKQLELLAEPEETDRAVRHGTLAVVGAAGRGFDLVVPLLSQRCELAFRASLGKLVRLRRRFEKSHAARDSNDGR